MKLLITGANRGLGYSLAHESLLGGHVVYAGVRDIRQADALLRLRERFPDRLHPIELDVSDEESVARAMGSTMELTDSLDGIVNNAAVMAETDKTIEELDMRLVRTTFEVNTFGPMRVVKHFLPLVLNGNDPSIIQISSEAGTILNAFGTNIPYSMSKTALNMFSERLRAYVGDKGIAVYAVHPGWMRTDMGGESAPEDPAKTAAAILRLMERKLKVTSKISFIDCRGRPMPL